MAAAAVDLDLAKSLLDSLIEIHEFEYILDQQILQLLTIQKLNKAAILRLHNNLKKLADKRKFDTSQFKVPIPRPLPDFSASTFGGSKGG